MFETLAYLVGFQYYVYLQAHSHDVYNEKQRWQLLLMAIIGALLGSRLLANAEHPALLLNILNHSQHYQQLSFKLFMDFLANKTIVGAILGALICIELYKKLHQLSASSGDLFTPPLIVGMIIGRIGCQLNGLADGTVGLPTQLPWGMDFGDGIYRHPTSLYEIMVLLAVFILIKLLPKYYRLRQGATFKIFLIIYLTYRFLVAFIEPRYLWLHCLSAIQIACLITLLCYARLYLNPLNLLDNENDNA